MQHVTYLEGVVQVAPNVVSDGWSLFRNFVDLHPLVDLLLLSDSKAVGVDPGTICTLKSGANRVEVVGRALSVNYVVSIGFLGQVDRQYLRQPLRLY